MNSTNARNNSFDIIRTIAALAVLLSHSFPIAGLAEPELVRGVTLGTLAVWVFFAISGYLVTISLLNSKSLSQFSAKRIFRIFPGLAFCLLFCTFLIGPLFTTLPLESYLSDGRAWTYLVKSPALANQTGLPGVFENTPLQYGVNGSLWSIKYELTMYFLLAVLAGMTGVIRNGGSNLSILVKLIVIACTGATALHELGVANIDRMFWRLERITHLRMDRLALLGGVFFSASLLATSYQRAVNGKAALAMIALLAISSQSVLFKPCVIVALPLVTIYLARLPPAVLGLRTPKHDLSYGIYLYAFPVQQATAHLGLAGPQLWSVALLTAGALSWVLAYLSWTYVEAPALALKSRWDQMRAKV